MAPPRSAESVGNFKKQLTTLFAKTEYIQRHNKAAAYLYWTVCKHYNIRVQDKHYEHEPATVTEKQATTILWDKPIQSDQEIKANRPDIVVTDKKERTCLLNYRHVYPHRKEHFVEKNGKTHKIQRS